FWIAVLFGTVAIGTNLTRTIQVVQISRDLGNMYAQGTDFSATGMQNLITGNSGNSASLVQGMDRRAVPARQEAYGSGGVNVLSGARMASGMGGGVWRSDTSEAFYEVIESGAKVCGWCLRSILRKYIRTSAINS